MLKPKNAKDAEVVDMIYSYQQQQPLNIIAKSFGVSRLLRLSGDNAKKLVRS